MSDSGERWRLVKVNGDMPGHFITIQFADFSVLPYRTDWRKHYEELAAGELWSEPSETGHKYGQWREPQGRSRR